VSGVFRTIDPPLLPASVSSPRTKGGGSHSQGGEGVGGQYFGRRQTLDWPLTVQSLDAYSYTVETHTLICMGVGHKGPTFFLKLISSEGGKNLIKIFIPYS
jgi:hypothetical protein